MNPTPISFSRSDPRSMNDIIIENIRGAREKYSTIDVNQEDPDMVMTVNEDSVVSDNDIDRLGPDCCEIFRYFFAVIVLASILRHLPNFRGKSKNIYVMKSEMWRDENGYRVALTATVSKRKHRNNGIPKDFICIPDTTMKRSDLRTKEGDLWLLLMSDAPEPKALTEK